MFNTNNIKQVNNVQVAKLIQLYKHYTVCDHLVKELQYEINIKELEKNSLDEIYPLEAGWIIERENDSIKLIQSVEGLCPEDAKKRHLAVDKGFLAIYQGPAHFKGPLQKITKININSLPVDWQEKIKSKSLEFSSESELLEALDSLDEYE